MSNNNQIPQQIPFSYPNGTIMVVVPQQNPQPQDYCQHQSNKCKCCSSKPSLRKDQNKIEEEETKSNITYVDKVGRAMGTQNSSPDELFQKQMSSNITKQELTQGLVYTHRIKTLFKNCIDCFYKLDKACDNREAESRITQLMQELVVCINCFISVMMGMKSEIKGKSYFESVVNETFSGDIQSELNKIGKTVKGVYLDAYNALETICLNKQLPNFMRIIELPSDEKKFQRTVDAYVGEQYKEQRDREMIRETGNLKDHRKYQHKYDKNKEFY